MAKFDTLIEAMTFYYEYDCRKHDLEPDAEEYAKTIINNMTNYELINAISYALEELNNGMDN